MESLYAHPNAISYLDRAIREWVPRNNLVVLLSFHAAKRSQNGMDHSAPSDPGKSYYGDFILKMFRIL